MRIATNSCVLVVLAGTVAATSCFRGHDDLFCETNVDCKDPALQFCTGPIPEIGRQANTCVAEQPILRCNAATPVCADPALICDPLLELCGECTMASDCAGKAAGAICLDGVAHEQAHQCGCLDHTDCSSSSLICETGKGACASADDVIYVKLNGGMDSAICGSKSSPCLTISQGIAQATMPNQQWVHVASGLYTEPIRIYARNIKLVGEPGVEVIHASVGQSVVVVSGDSNVEIDGFLVEGGEQAGETGGHGIDCQTSTLQVRRSTLKLNKGNGIHALGCKLTVEQSEIGNGPNQGNAEGGIFIDEGEFALVNNIIADNGSTTGDTSGFGGVLIQGGARGTLEFNTITSNTMASNGDSAGVQCFQSATNAFTPSNNLIQGNTPAAIQVQGMNCTWRYTAFGPMDPAGENTTSMPCSLAADRRLMTGDTACKDRADPNATVKVDIDGNIRPAGPAPDIGASELP